ncbi:Tigger transposable element-derived protein 6, partial [Dictyocoela muelleri]
MNKINIENNFRIKITDYFIREFIKRNGLKYLNLHGESKSADLSNISEFLENYNSKLKTYKQEDIFNLDETALFIKNISRKTYVIDNKDNKNIKIDKSRITVLLNISQAGERLPLLIIGKSKNPRVLKDKNMKNFNIIYKSNSTAWMTRSIFFEYINTLNEKFIRLNRKCLFLLDNCSSHCIENFSNIEFLFLPKNTTSILHPLDLGIIHSFKSIYKSNINNFLINSLDFKE